MKLTDEQKNEIISFTVELVRLAGDSGHEAATARCVYRKMEELGYDEVTVDEYGSVIGILKGQKEGPALLFDGHMDVVPVRDREDWTHEPYGAEISEGRIWGRGTADMKGALAAMICAPTYLEKTDFSGRIIVSASVAEELLIGSALEKILQRYRADAVVIGEPTGLKPGTAEKGRSSVEMICSGTVAHSSRPDLGDNAVYRMMEAVERIRRMPRRSHPLLGEEVIELVEITSEPSPGNGSIPDKCRVLWECRLLSGEREEEYLERWKSALEGTDRTEIKIASYNLPSYRGPLLTMKDFLPGWIGSEIDHSFTALVGRSLKKCGKAVHEYASPFGCNALISAARMKIPTVILGPGDIALAHKPDESIVIDELLSAASVYGTIARNFLNS
ncbi:M20/M25/M40 family metallo-hydrolase [Spirochaeta isovalerica]|uniref:Putative selenium metabolism hydrolase n=1 Tax=Spirochaeta isovalerica TaxID=150 RepID=A0A841R938_9SPIO|nr:M20/M25/M40 family metallo-hydrolase [Spirochaeta isovalerica]MBB6480306.1 putative selenium metabolism hydrolase [Spirochaeta isovalerica]